MENKADKNILKNMQMQLDNLKVQALTMTQESIVEALVPHTWWNPFPKVRYTERPDTAASNILEGKNFIACGYFSIGDDTAYQFFDFVQEPQDYYLPPVTGNYLRFLRILVFFCLFMYYTALVSLYYQSTAYPLLFKLYLIKRNPACTYFVTAVINGDRNRYLENSKFKYTKCFE